MQYSPQTARIKGNVKIYNLKLVTRDNNRIVRKTNIINVLLHLISKEYYKIS